MQDEDGFDVTAAGDPVGDPDAEPRGRRSGRSDAGRPRVTSSTVAFVAPRDPPPVGVHRAAARAGNDAVADAASATLAAVLDGDEPYERLLLKAAAGAGKSYILKRLVVEAVAHDNTRRVAVVAFTNKQTRPLAARPRRDARAGPRVPVRRARTGSATYPPTCPTARPSLRPRQDIPDACDVVVATCHKLGAIGERGRQLEHFGPGVNGNDPFDVLFVDEAWQVAHHLFDRVDEGARRSGSASATSASCRRSRSARTRGAATRATTRGARGRPTTTTTPRTWSAELPGGVASGGGASRPVARLLPGVGRAQLRRRARATAGLELGEMPAASRQRSGTQVATGVPTLLEVDGLAGRPKPPTSTCRWSSSSSRCSTTLFAAGFALDHARDYDDDGDADRDDDRRSRPGDTDGDPLVAVLATRNQAVDDAADAVERLREKHGLTEHDLARVDRRLLAGADERHHRRDPPAHRRVAARRVQLGVRPPRRDVHARDARAAARVAARPRRAAPRRAGSARARRSASRATASCRARPTSASSPRSPVGR